jgi:long-chain acyl-CoA synthetase
MADRGRQMSDALAAAGVPDDAPIGLIPRNRPLSVAALLELLIAGRSIVMIYAFQSAAAIARDVESLRLAAVVGDRQDWSVEAIAAARSAGTAAIRLDPDSPDGGAIALVPEAALCGPGPHRPPFAVAGIEMLTSGTTGTPKRVAMDFDIIFRSMVGESTVLADAAPDRPQTPGLLIYPFGNISGLYTFLPVAASGRPTLMVEKFNLPDWLDYVKRFRPLRASLPPAGIQMLLDADIPPGDISGIEAIHSGAARLDPHVQARFERLYGIPILLGYGATEFGGPVTNMTLEDARAFGESKRGSVGRVWAGARLRILDPDTLEELPNGAEGLIEVSTPRMGDHWIRTTDLGLIDEDGFVFHRGRADGAISRGGFKILPEVVASALQTHPSIAAVAVVGLPDRRLGQVPAAAIELRPGAAAPSFAQLEAHARQTLYSTHIPARFLIVDALPRTPSLKISLPGVLALFDERETASAGASASQEAEPPR